MRKGRFFRRKLYHEPNAGWLHHTRFTDHFTHDRLDDTLHRLSHYGRRLRSSVETTTREHPIATLVSAGVLGGLLLWALLQRPERRRSEGEGLEHW